MSPRSSTPAGAPCSRSGESTTRSRVLDAMRTGGELAPQLEAERCRDLAAAWERKGQADYASDYRERARLVAR